MQDDDSAKRPDQFVGEQVRIAREGRRWKQEDLVNRLEELGFTQWRQSKVTKIENGQVKRLSLEDVLALAAALGVQPVHLMAPEGAMVEIAPKVVRNADDFESWMTGSLPLIPEDGRTYRLGPIVPDAAIQRATEILALMEARSPGKVGSRAYQDYRDDLKEGLAERQDAPDSDNSGEED